MNLFLRELKKNSRAFVIWAVALIGVNLMLLFGFETAAQDALNAELLMSQYPEAFIKAFNLDQLFMADILHYFSSRSYLLIGLFGSIYVMILASTILSKEESERTVEFLLSKPVTRSGIVTSKLLCVVFYITLLNLLFSVTNFVFMNMFKIEDFDMTGFLLVSIGPWCIHMIFAAIGLLISVYVTRARTIISASMGVVFIGYLLSLIAGLQDNLDFLKYFNPFSYYDTAFLVVDTSIPAAYIVLSVGIVAAAIAGTYYLYSRKDIKA